MRDFCQHLLGVCNMSDSLFEVNQIPSQKGASPPCGMQENPLSVENRDLNFTRQDGSVRIEQENLSPLVMSKYLTGDDSNCQVQEQNAPLADPSSILKQKNECDRVVICNDTGLIVKLSAGSEDDTPTQKECVDVKQLQTVLESNHSHAKKESVSVPPQLNGKTEISETFTVACSQSEDELLQAEMDVQESKTECDVSSSKRGPFVSQDSNFSIISASKKTLKNKNEHLRGKTKRKFKKKLTSTKRKLLNKKKLKNLNYSKGMWKLKNNDTSETWTNLYKAHLSWFERLKGIQVPFSTCTFTEYVGLVQLESSFAIVCNNLRNASQSLSVDVQNLNELFKSLPQDSSYANEEQLRLKLLYSPLYLKEKNAPWRKAYTSNGAADDRHWQGILYMRKLWANLSSSVDDRVKCLKMFLSTKIPKTESTITHSICKSLGIPFCWEMIGIVSGILKELAASGDIFDVGGNVVKPPSVQMASLSLSSSQSRSDSTLEAIPKKCVASISSPPMETAETMKEASSLNQPSPTNTGFVSQENESVPEKSTSMVIPGSKESCSSSQESALKNDLTKEKSDEILPSAVLSPPESDCSTAKSTQITKPLMELSPESVAKEGTSQENSTPLSRERESSSLESRSGIKGSAQTVGACSPQAPKLSTCQEPTTKGNGNPKTREEGALDLSFAKMTKEISSVLREIRLPGCGVLRVESGSQHSVQASGSQDSAEASGSQDSAEASGSQDSAEASGSQDSVVLETKPVKKSKSPSGVKRKRKESSLPGPECLVPLKMTPAWVREVVYRGISESVSADVYYHPPQGRKLRSMVEVRKYLAAKQEQVLTEANFSYLRAPLDFGPPYELVRNARQINCNSNFKRKLENNDVDPKEDASLPNSVAATKPKKAKSVAATATKQKKKPPVKSSVSKKAKESVDGFLNDSWGDEVAITNELGETTGYEDWIGDGQANQSHETKTKGKNIPGKQGLDKTAKKHILSYSKKQEENVSKQMNICNSQEIGDPQYSQTILNSSLSTKLSTIRILKKEVRQSSFLASTSKPFHGSSVSTNKNSQGSFSKTNKSSQASFPLSTNKDCQSKLKKAHEKPLMKSGKKDAIKSKGVNNQYSKLSWFHIIDQYDKRRGVRKDQNVPLTVTPEVTLLDDEPLRVWYEPFSSLNLSAPVVENPAPVLERPFVVSVNPAPVLERPFVVSDNPAPVLEKPAVVAGNSVPANSGRIRVRDFTELAADSDLQSPASGSNCESIQNTATQSVGCNAMSFATNTLPVTSSGNSASFSSGGFLLMPHPLPNTNLQQLPQNLSNLQLCKYPYIIPSEKKRGISSVNPRAPLVQTPASGPNARLHNQEQQKIMKLVQQNFKPGMAGPQRFALAAGTLSMPGVPKFTVLLPNSSVPVVAQGAIPLVQLPLNNVSPQAGNQGTTQILTNVPYSMINIEKSASSSSTQPVNLAPSQQNQATCQTNVVYTQPSSHLVLPNASSLAQTSANSSQNLTSGLGFYKER